MTVNNGKTVKLPAADSFEIQTVLDVHVQWFATTGTADDMWQLALWCIELFSFAVADSEEFYTLKVLH